MSTKGKVFIIIAGIVAVTATVLAIIKKITNDNETNS